MYTNTFYDSSQHGICSSCLQTIDCSGLTQKAIMEIAKKAASNSIEETRKELTLANETLSSLTRKNEIQSQLILNYQLQLKQSKEDNDLLLGKIHLSVNDTPKFEFNEENLTKLKSQIENDDCVMTTPNYLLRKNTLTREY